MLNKALLLINGVKGEPTLTIKWDTFPVNDKYSVWITVNMENGEQEVVTLDGLDGTKGLSFPISMIKSKPTYDGHFHVSNSKMVAGWNELQVSKAENVFYTEELSAYDDYIYFAIESLDKDALVELCLQ